MSFTVTCSCGLKYKVREDKRGKTFACKGCDAVVVIPAAEPKPDDEFAEFEDLNLKDFGAADDEWADVSTDFEAAPPRRKAASDFEMQPRKAGGKRKKRPAVEEPPPPNKKLFVIAGAAGGGVLLLIVVLMVILIRSGKSDDAGDSGDPDPVLASGELVDPHGGAPQAGGGGGAAAQQPQQKASPLPEQFTVVVADATPPKGLSSLMMLATAKAAENWTVKIAGREPSKDLGSAWYVADDPAPADKNDPKQPPLSRKRKLRRMRPTMSTAAGRPRLLTTGGRRAALLAAPATPTDARFYEIDLTKPGAVTKFVKLSPADPEEVARQASRSRWRHGTFWRSNDPRQTRGNLRPRDRYAHVAAVNPAFTRIANGLQDNSKMQLWDGGGKPLASVDAPAKSQWVFAEFPDDNSLCLLAADGTAKVIDASSGKPAHAADCNWRGWAAMSPDRKYVVGCNGSDIEFRDVRTLKVAGKLPLPADLLKATKLYGPSLHVSLDGQHLAALFVAEKDYVLLAWDLAAGKLTDAYIRRAHGTNLWVQWVGKRRLVIAGGNQIQYSVLDLDRRAIVYTGNDINHAPSVDGRIWRIGSYPETSIQQNVFRKLTGEQAPRRLPAFLLAGVAIPKGVEQSLQKLRGGLPLNRNFAVRAEVAGRKHWPLKETADGFTAYLSKQGFTVDPNAKLVYRLVLDYKSVRINRAGFVTPGIRGNPGVAFEASFELGKSARRFSVYRGWAVLSEGAGPSAPRDLGVGQWESQYPAATKKARQDFLKSIKAVMEGRSGGSRGVGLPSETESYYVSGGKYSVRRGNFPVDGY